MTDLTGHEPQFNEPTELTDNEPVLGGPLSDGRNLEQLIIDGYDREELYGILYGGLFQAQDAIEKGQRAYYLLVNDYTCSTFGDMVIGIALHSAKKGEQVWVDMSSNND